VRRARSIVVYYLRGVGVVDGAAAAARDGACGSRRLSGARRARAGFGFSSQRARAAARG
jgi:hypothetical protein